MMRIQYSEGINFDGLMVGKDLRNGGPLVMLICTIAKLIKDFGTIASVFEFNIDLHYMCLSS